MEMSNLFVLEEVSSSAGLGEGLGLRVQQALQLIGPPSLVQHIFLSRLAKSTTVRL